jgi:hypothetical protein
MDYFSDEVWTAKPGEAPEEGKAEGDDENQVGVAEGDIELANVDEKESPKKKKKNAAPVVEEEEAGDDFEEAPKKKSKGEKKGKKGKKGKKEEDEEGGLDCTPWCF